jgi:hypothetical protein
MLNYLIHSLCQPLASLACLLRCSPGQANLKTFAQAHSIQSKQTMTNYFCQTCGTLMYRVGARFPGYSILRLGTVDDFSVVEVRNPFPFG